MKLLFQPSRRRQLVNGKREREERKEWKLKLIDFQFKLLIISKKHIEKLKLNGEILFLSSC